MSYFSVDKQKNLAIRLGLNPDEYDSNDLQIVNKFAFVFMQAQLSEKDMHGNKLSREDLDLLSYFTKL